MDINFGILPVLFGWATALFIVYALLYNKYIYSIIDPLFMWIFTTAFSSVLAIQIIPTLQDLLHFFGCQIALWAGFAIAYRKTNYLDSGLNQTGQVYEFSDQLLLRWITYTLLGVYILSNIIIGYNKGFALLSDAPTQSKIANFQEGFGLFRKINWSTGTFVSTGLVFMYFLKKRQIDLLFLLIVILLHTLDGSKTALLQVIISIGIVLYHPAFSYNKNALKKFQRYLPVIFLGIMGIFFTVLIKENNGYEEAFLAFITRLLYSADSVLYFYMPANVDYFADYSFWDYFPRLVNPILGFLRLAPYQEALGNTMVDNLRPPGYVQTNVTVGPNAPFYIEGRIYFYYWLAFPYSLLVGYLYALIRKHFFSLTRTSAFYFVYMGSFCHLAYALIVDVNLAITQSFDLAFFVIPPYIVLSFLLTSKLTIRLSPFLFKFYKNNLNL
ncbi:oligosaccharide repeat unit polymerase [Spirosoma endbachense]|uniref:Oligosaccharide repeat unit polymerase n=1 Tax=Spirosoma endbachense TaxID=2666025 RepID=A0A6P1W652_9BACT|nr:oligosaccharide repeat unit polymerase [Spirosoma endbachense]QHW00496.1 oligosaccharide repeat unit polymerase [Spirosoma endbachense]